MEPVDLGSTGEENQDGTIMGVLHEVHQQLLKQVVVYLRLVEADQVLPCRRGIASVQLGVVSLAQDVPACDVVPPAPFDEVLLVLGASWGNGKS